MNQTNPKKNVKGLPSWLRSEEACLPRPIDGFQYSCVEDYILRHGRLIPVKPPNRLKEQKLRLLVERAVELAYRTNQVPLIRGWEDGHGECYSWAFAMSRLNGIWGLRIQYVEGYYLDFVTGHVVGHGFNLVNGTRILDMQGAGGAPCLGNVQSRAYFGVVAPLSDIDSAEILGGTMLESHLVHRGLIPSSTRQANGSIHKTLAQQNVQSTEELTELYL